MGATSWDGTPGPSVVEDLMLGKVMVAAIIILVMVILFVLMVHLYARWLVGGPDGLRRPRRRLVFAPTQDPEPSHSGLEASVVRALPLVIFKQEDLKEGLECAVCLCELEDGEKARLLPKCNHGFHVECIDMWFQSHSTCPLCRITIGLDTSKSSPETQPEGAHSASDSARINGQEEVPATSSSPQSPCSAMATPSTSRDGSMIIDIPRHTEEDMKSPVTQMSARLRSLSWLFSREKSIVPPSPGSVDVEQGGGGGSGQSSKTMEE